MHTQEGAGWHKGLQASQERSLCSRGLGEVDDMLAVLGPGARPLCLLWVQQWLARSQLRPSC